MAQIILKRDGAKETFDKKKVEEAALKAFKAVDGKIDEYAETKCENIADFVEDSVRSNKDHTYHVEEIQDMVENGLMSTKRKDVARAYIIYRNHRNEVRGNTTDKEIEEIASGTSEYWNTENSNKNAIVVTTQRDYFAGATSVDLSRRKLLAKDIVKAHDEGEIHFHKKIVA
jgi:ribonucleoside-triphosphate reductase